FLVFFLLLGLLVSAIPFLPRAKDLPPPPVAGIVLGDLAIALILAACVWKLRRLARAARGWILVFAEGLARYDWQSLVTRRWEEIESVQGIIYKAPTPFASHVIVTMPGGKEMRTYWAKKHLAEGQALFQRLAEESTRHLLPRSFAAVEAGATVTFQAPTTGWVGGTGVWSRLVLGISKSGLHWGTYVFPWDDMENIDCTAGLRVRSPGQTKLALFHSWIPVADIPIPNSLVFLRLAEHYLRENGRQSGTSGQIT